MQRNDVLRWFEGYYLSVAEGRSSASRQGVHCDFIEFDEILGLPFCARAALSMKTLLHLLQFEGGEYSTIKFAFYKSEERILRTEKVSDSEFVIHLHCKLLIDIELLFANIAECRVIAESIFLEKSDHRVDRISESLTSFDSSPEMLFKNWNAIAPLSVCAIQYLFMHEIAHIVNGHIDYREHVLGSCGFIDPSVSQCLEFDADIFATRYTIRSMQSYPIEVMMEHSKNPNVLYATFGLSVFSVFYFDSLFWNDVEVLGLLDVRNSSHPHGINRFFSILYEANEVLREAQSAHSPECDLDLGGRPASLPIELVFHNVKFKNIKDDLGTRNKLIEFAELSAQCNIAHMEIAWADIRDELNKFRRRKCEVPNINFTTIDGKDDIFNKALQCFDEICSIMKNDKITDK